MISVGSCATEGCQVAEGGSCIEGFDDLVECPNFSRAEEGETEISGAGTEAPNGAKSGGDEGIQRLAHTLSSGKALTLQEAHQLTGECAANVVVLMGMVKSGKTTVLAEIYERFCRGPFAGYLFAGSKTIMGFEQICYLSRAVSQGEIEDTDRTKRGLENNLLHLDLVAQGNGFRQRLLISDLSGELFEAATESNEVFLTIPYLRRADQIVVFADAEKVGDITERQHLLNQLLVLLRCCIEESRVRHDCRVTVTVSRHDLLPGDIDRAFMKSMEARIRQRTDGFFDEPARFLDLAARPTTGSEDSYGLQELLTGWLDEPRLVQPRTPALIEPVEKSAREIDKFAFKVLADEQ